MKIKLVEAAMKYSKVQNNVENIILPALEEMGFSFNSSRMLRNSGYDQTYMGQYTDKNDDLHMVSLNVSTTHRDMDKSLKDDIFLELTYDGTRINLGGCNSKDGHMAQDLVDFSLSDASKEGHTRLNVQVPTPEQKDGDTEFTYNNRTMTRREWFTKCQHALKQDPHMAGTIINSLPGELHDELLTELNKVEDLNGYYINNYYKAVTKLLKEMK